jgi:hypothetical protein
MPPARASASKGLLTSPAAPPDASLPERAPAAGPRAVSASQPAQPVKPAATDGPRRGSRLESVEGLRQGLGQRRMSMAIRSVDS